MTRFDDYDASGQRWDRYGPVSPHDPDCYGRDPLDEVLVDVGGGRVGRVVPVEELEDEAA